MNETGYKGMQDQTSAGSEFNAMSFVITQILNKANTSTLVRIAAVTNEGELSAVGFVDVEPLVFQVAGDGRTVPHGIIHNVPYFRLQGGGDAVILDPKVGDIGIAIFADHDISAVKASKDAAPPGSMRRFDMADGLYMGGFLNGVPTQYVMFSVDGIKVVSPTKITCEAPTIEHNADSFVVNAAAIALNGNATVTGNASVVGSMTNNGKNIGSTHTHGGVAVGAGHTAAPD